MCVCICISTRVHVDILCNNISDERGINCQRLAPLMLLFLPLWQLCRTVQSSTGDTKKILRQSSSRLSRHCSLTLLLSVNLMNPLSFLHYQLSASFTCDITILRQIGIHTVKVMCDCVSIHYFQAFVFANAVHAHTIIHTFRHKYPSSPVPVCFQTEFPNLLRCRGEVGTARAYGICVLCFLSQSPGLLFRVFIKLKSWTTHCFPLTLGREQKRIEKKTREKGFLITLNNTPN